MLIASILTEKQIQRFLSIAEDLGMEAICEIHNEVEIKKVLRCNAKIIGINNRDLQTFKIDLGTVERLASMIPNDKMIISESGVKSREDILAMPANINAVLVGTTLMTSENPDLKIRELRGTVLKICGIRKLEDAAFCEKNFVDFVGLNFVTQSKRCIDLQMAIKIRAKLKNTKCVGVFQNQNLKYVNEIAEILNLDFIQLSGDESLDFVKKCIRPIIKTIRGDLKLAERFYDAGP